MVAMTGEIRAQGKAERECREIAELERLARLLLQIFASGLDLKAH